jgi:hypothetical protein
MRSPPGDSQTRCALCLVGRSYALQALDGLTRCIDVQGFQALVQHLLVPAKQGFSAHGTGANPGPAQSRLSVCRNPPPA